MKIVSAELRLLEADSVQVKFSHLTIPKRSMLLLSIHTDSGIVGFGEIDAGATGLPGTIELASAKYLPLLMGKDPLMVGQLWGEVFNTIKPLGRFRSTEMYILGAIDIALWDIIGKAADLPLATLLGQSKDKTPAYASLGYVPSSRVKEQIEKAALLGFTGVKIRLGIDFDEDRQIIENAKDIVDSDMRLMVDVNSAWDPVSALRKGRALEEYGLDWIEEPLEPYYLDATAKLALVLDTPIALGEHEIFHLYDATEVLSKAAADIIQPDLRAGGITECRRIAALAEAHGVLCIPHFYGNAIRYAALVHFAASSLGTTWVETDIHENPLRTDIFEGVPEVIDGFVSPNREPGLGISMKEQEIDHYTTVKRVVHM